MEISNIKRLLNKTLSRSNNNHRNAIKYDAAEIYRILSQRSGATF
jgi:hypothetical protein